MQKTNKDENISIFGHVYKHYTHELVNYNHSKYIETAIDSIQNHHYQKNKKNN